MSILNITFLVGLALLVVAILGGGIEVKEIKIPTLPIVPRTLSFILGCVLLAVCVLSPQILEPKVAWPEPKVASPSPQTTDNRRTLQTEQAADQHTYKYDSSELRMQVVYPNDVLTLDDTRKKERKLELVEVNHGDTLVTILRSPLPKHKDLRMGKEIEIRELESKGARVTYQKEGSNWYVLSGVDHGKEFYFRRWYCGDGIASMEFTYKKEFAPVFDKIIPMITRRSVIYEGAQSLETCSHEG